jgi:hypothetical protein
VCLKQSGTAPRGRRIRGQGVESTHPLPASTDRDPPQRSISPGQLPDMPRSAGRTGTRTGGGQDPGHVRGVSALLPDGQTGAYWAAVRGVTK